MSTRSPTLNRRVLLTALARCNLVHATPSPLCARSGTLCHRPAALMERRPRQAGNRGLCEGDHRHASPKFVPPEERIATFDQDGTLWVEHPVYTQIVFCLDHVGDLVKEKPELKDREPFKTVLSGDREAIAKFSMDEFFEIVMATQSGMTVEEFTAEFEKVAGRSQGSALAPALHRTGVPADEGGAELFARQRLQDLHRDRRQRRLRARHTPLRSTASLPSRSLARRSL